MDWDAWSGVHFIINPISGQFSTHKEMDWTIDTYVLYADDALLVVNKPAGLLSLPDGYHPDLPHLRSVLEPQFGRLWIVHRLDKETSGVVLLARSQDAHRALNDAFASRATIKTYHALVIGEPTWQQHTVDLPLLPDGDRRHRTIVHVERGKVSITRLHVMERFRSYTLIKAMPKTGRTHQIRAHLAALGFPIVADALYGNRSSSDAPPIDRLGLHARSIQIVHPTVHQEMCFDAPYPQDFQAALRTLGKRETE